MAVEIEAISTSKNIPSSCGPRWHGRFRDGSPAWSLEYTDSASGAFGAIIDQDGQASIDLMDPQGNATTSSLDLAER